MRPVLAGCNCFRKHGARGGTHRHAPFSHEPTRTGTHYTRTGTNRRFPALAHRTHRAPIGVPGRCAPIYTDAKQAWDAGAHWWAMPSSAVAISARPVRMASGSFCTMSARAVSASAVSVADGSWVEVGNTCGRPSATPMLWARSTSCAARSAFSRSRSAGPASRQAR